LVACFQVKERIFSVCTLVLQKEAGSNYFFEITFLWLKENEYARHTSDRDGNKSQY